MINKKQKTTGETKFFTLGGLSEVGKNMHCIEYNNEIIIIDSGIMFPKDELMGIDYVLPDFTYLKQNEDKIKALIITHGHEDHIGGIPFLVTNVNIPVIYAPTMAIGLIKNKLIDRKIKYDNIETVIDDTTVRTNHFEIEFFRTNHSIPDSFGVVIHTPNGTIVETGDFKFDLTPIGPSADLHKMAKIGENGVKLLISDSTNAQNSGFSKSESIVDNALNEIFESHKGRIIISTFASNVYRLKHIISTCKKHNRKIVSFGRSMVNNIEIAQNMGYIEEKNIFVDPHQVNNFKPNEICILCTGSQGEPLAALSRIANGTHKQIKLQQMDLVVFSSSPIPGNDLSVSNTINKLYMQGVKVYTNAFVNDIHASGHGSSEDLKLMLRLMKPEYFMPGHGEYPMLREHAKLAVATGIPKNNIFINENGDVLNIKKIIVKKGKVPAEDIYVDGNIDNINGIVIRDRVMMATDGIIVVTLNLGFNNKIIGKVNVNTRGFILQNENVGLIKNFESYIFKQLNKNLTEKMSNNDIRSLIITEMNPYVIKRTGKNPLILPVVLNLKK
ncbi:MAG: ribonuclease J [Bacilli bacterium]